MCSVRQIVMPPSNGASLVFVVLPIQGVGRGRGRGNGTGWDEKIMRCSA